MMSDELRCVSQGFNSKVNMYEKYDVNGYRFHIEGHQNSRPRAKTINTGVFTKGQDDFDYYGRLQNVYELTFSNGPQNSISLCSDATSSIHTMDREIPFHRVS